MSQFIQEFKSIKDIASEYGDKYNEDKTEYNKIMETLSDAVVHLAWYGYGSYCGESLVIYEKDGVLYEVNGSHCSCYGLEGQWHPEETSWKALGMRRLLYGECDGADAAQTILTQLINQNGPAN